MRDLKYLTKQRRYSAFLLKRKKKTLNTFKQLHKNTMHLRITLIVLAIVLALYPFGFVIKTFAPKITSLMQFSDKYARASTPEVDPYQSFHLVSQLLNSARLQDNMFVTSMKDGGTVRFTINAALQNRVMDVMQDNGVPFGVFVAIEPGSGKILALAGYSSIDPTWRQKSYFSLYPMASLFKIITAAAALEMNKVEPETNFEYRGYSYSEDPKYWNIYPGQSNQSMPLSLAMGKSINPVFGRLASDYVGTESLMDYAQRFGFNQTLFPALPIAPSKAAVPQDDRQLKLMGCGLGREVKISPFHAAVIMAAIANQGEMMAPFMVQDVRDADNRMLYSIQARSIRRLVRSETANQLTHMLLTTVTHGTSRKAFHDRHGRPLLDSVTVAAKTGSINGTNPAGHYSWFAAYAPVDKPKIALVALIVNQNKWKIKASYLGAQALEQFFDKNEL